MEEEQVNLEKVFRTKYPIIGALHFSPMIGYPDFEGTEFVLRKGLMDLKAFEKGGVDGIIIENNYDLPHKIIVSHETVAMMTFLAIKLKENTNLPLGINVLWNDYEAALSIAKVVGLKFVRIPVFVDNVRTSFGDIFGKAKEVISYRQKIQAEEVGLFTDIQVKHAQMLDLAKSIGVSAQQAIEAGSDGLIVTGKWTGDAPKIEDLVEARKSAGDFPILIGSGATKENVSVLLKFADGIIVSTSLKSGKYLKPKENRNLKDHHEVIDADKVKEFVTICKDSAREKE